MVPIHPLESFAESMGFEPMKAFTPYLVSSEALSTTQPTLHYSVWSKVASSTYRLKLVSSIPLTKFADRMKSKEILTFHPLSQLSISELWELE